MGSQDVVMEHPNNVDQDQRPSKKNTDLIKDKEGLKTIGKLYIHCWANFLTLSFGDKC